jgi:hypothetical protein
MRALHDIARRVVPARLRFEARQFAAAFRAHVANARVWRWECVAFSHGQAPYQVLYVGPKEHRTHAAALLNLSRAPAEPADPALGPRTALVSHAPLPGAFKVPHQVHMVVRLDQPLDELIKRFDPELRRKLMRTRAAYTSRRVVDPAEIDALTDTMLEPYARDRHGADAQPLGKELVRRIAQGSGGLDVIEKDGIKVACHLGYARTDPPPSTWICLRFGYPPEVFGDRRKLGDINAMNVFMAMEWSHAQGFGAYDMGSCTAQPDDGLLQWKRRRGGFPDTLHNAEWLHVRLPKAGAAEFLWDAPLFATERGGLTLQLGLPEEKSDDQALERFHPMRFDGLNRVVLHAARAPGQRLLERLAALFSTYARPPELQAVPAT